MVVLSSFFTNERTCNVLVRVQVVDSFTPTAARRLPPGSNFPTIFAPALAPPATALAPALAPSATHPAALPTFLRHPPLLDDPELDDPELDDPEPLGQVGLHPTNFLFLLLDKRRRPLGIVPATAPAVSAAASATAAPELDDPSVFTPTAARRLRDLQLFTPYVFDLYVLPALQQQ